jgi:hypothetical protein
VVVLIIVALIFVGGVFLHVRNPALSDRPIPSRTPLPPTNTPPPTATPEPSPYEDYKRLLFADETLEELANRYSPESGILFEPFYQAYNHTQQGESLQAIEVLQAFAAQPDTELRARLWAWNALRDLGIKPTVRAQDVQGVVLEIPAENAIDTLAVYADGHIRFVSYLGGIFNWEEDLHDDLVPLALAVIAAAQPFSGQSEPIDQHLPENPAVVRASLLTYGGIYVVESSYVSAMRGSGTLAPILDAAAALITAIVNLEERGREA